MVQTASLGFAFDRDYATHYARRADCVVEHRPQNLLDDNDGYVVHDLIHFFEAKSKSGSSPESSVIRGARFIKCVIFIHISCVLCLIRCRHVLDKRLHIDIVALLNLTESVFARAIISSRRSVHDLTLPRSWILNWLSTWDGPLAIKYDTTILQMLHYPLKELLEAICLGQDISMSA